MFPLEEATKHSLLRRLEFARSELNDLKEYTNLDYQTYSTQRVIRRNVERMIENICNALTDIGKIIIAQSDDEMPETYKEVFVRLGALGFIDQDVAAALAGATKLRNVLAHQYLDIKWQYIREFLVHDVKEAERFVAVVERWLS
ncbi:MAG TPA: DUF86 domain-containing protein [Firmicutes bacterium]|uniref:type VII toxin-antitoxin system HepT family RNase toxin n=1 Tax=Gelria sp. Kuro-4 TaxID=2796927 RepID=UPI0019C73529|nr:HepT-like ribonuclease domain-containing protein [Gelria sp. Kuro-4]BCV24253.1 hypothetical protein kuro4_10260 [Gelria sp. Kuro-4]HHV56758.1 DUF86 domain-containing protein [Bacillota bacterium]